MLQASMVDLAPSTVAWDAFVSRSNPGSYLQTSAWAEVKAPNGWTPLRFMGSTIAAPGSAAAEASGTGGGAGAVPSAPTNFSATNVAGGTVNLSWAPVASATTYHVKRGTVYSGPYTDVGIAIAPANTYADTSGLTDGTWYYYAVSAANALGDVGRCAGHAARRRGQ